VTTDANTPAPSELGVRTTSIEADMEAFDALPAELRARLNEAPYQMSAEYVLDRVRYFGRRVAILEYETDCAKLNGGRPWVPPRSRRV
jgi:hypothetical protein